MSLVDIKRSDYRNGKLITIAIECRIYCLSGCCSIPDRTISFVAQTVILALIEDRIEQSGGYEVTWNLNPIILEIGPVQIRYYGILFGLTVYFGWKIFRWQMISGKYSERGFEWFFPAAVIAVVVGSRVGQVLFYDLDYYRQQPREIVYIWKGGMASHGAALALMLTLAILAIQQEVSILDVFDRFAPSAALGVALVRIGNFTNSEILGQVTTRPWGVRFTWMAAGQSADQLVVPARHPSQIYEALLGLAILIALAVIHNVKGEDRPRGLYSGIFLVAYFGGRILLETYRDTDRFDYFGTSLTMGQTLSIPFAILGSLILASCLHGRLVHKRPDR